MSVCDARPARQTLALRQREQPCNFAVHDLDSEILALRFRRGSLPLAARSVRHVAEALHSNTTFNLCASICLSISTIFPAMAPVPTENFSWPKPKFTFQVRI